MLLMSVNPSLARMVALAQMEYLITLALVQSDLLERYVRQVHGDYYKVHEKYKYELMV